MAEDAMQEANDRNSPGPVYDHEGRIESGSRGSQNAPPRRIWKIVRWQWREIWHIGYPSVD